MSVELLLGLVGAVATIVTGAWALLKLAGVQFDKRLSERFDAIDKSRLEGAQQWDLRFSRMEQSQHNLERDMLGLKADLPVNYVRREDHIRFETGIYGKLDSLNAKLDQLNDRYAIGSKLELLDRVTRDVQEKR